jgi:hypothetical protein
MVRMTGLIPGRAKIFLFTPLSRSDVGKSQPPLWWILGHIPWMKEVARIWNYISTLPYIFMA